MYKVSILIPIYGVEQYIERCSISLFSQSYHNLEFVFVNDCTPDQSVDLLKGVAEKYPERKGSVKIINHEKNRGLAASRNTGLDHSTGAFVVCVDSDDWLEPYAIEMLVNKQKENDADIVSGDRLIHYENEEHLFPERDYGDKDQMVLQMMQHTWDHFITGRLLRRAIFIDNGLRWQEGFNVAEDRYMMTLLSYHAKAFDSVNGVVYHYERRNFNALTKASDGKTVFRNNRQELGNILFLEQFFKGKKTVYQKECSRCVMEQLKNNLQATISFSDKKEFDHVVEIIISRGIDEQKLIGWGKNSLFGWLKHQYGYMLLAYKKYKAIRFIRKRVKAFFCHNLFCTI